MPDKKLLIHIGYHKTASTFLQEKVFSNQQNGFYTQWSRSDYYDKLILVNPFSFDGVQTRSFFEPGIREADQKSLTPVISEEAFSGNIYQGGYNDKSLAERLQSTFPEAKILIIIREQSSIIKSIYQERIRSSLAVSIQDFLEQPEPTTGFNPWFKLEYLEYHWLIAHYQNLFGRDNVLVIPYEMLKHQKSEFLDKISIFSDADICHDLSKQTVNKGYFAATLALKRWSNIFAPKTIIPNNTRYQKINNSLFYKINQIIPSSLNNKVEKQLINYIKQRIQGFYRQSNQKTSELTGLDLNSYGYEI